jgi:single stranded DNA-binding protein
MNQVCLNGRLAQDPEGGESGKGVLYATFNLAITKLSNGQQEVMYVSCCAFRATAEFVRKHFNKGDRINISGTLNVREWTDQSGAGTRSSRSSRTRLASRREARPRTEAATTAPEPHATPNRSPQAYPPNRLPSPTTRAASRGRRSNLAATFFSLKHQYNHRGDT